MRLLILAIFSLYCVGLSAQLPGPDLNNRARITGYIAYQDNTSSSSLVTAGDTVQLTLSRDLVERRNAPIGTTDLVSASSTIIGQFGDAYIAHIEFTVTQLVNTDTRIAFWIDIGGTVPPLYMNSRTLTRGINETSDINESTAVYTLDTWEANEGTIYFTTNQSCNVLLTRIVVYKIHEGTDLARLTVAP